MGKKLIIKGADFSAVAVDTDVPTEVTIKSKLYTDGVAYIDTQKILTANDVLEIQGCCGNDLTSNTSFLFGWRNTGAGAKSNGNTQIVGNSEIGNWTVISGGYNPNERYSIVTPNTEHTFKFDYVNSKTYIDSLEQNTPPQINMGTALGTISLCLFTANIAGTILSNVGATPQSYIKRCKITRNGVTILNLVPCINSQNQAGMYDKVTGTFVGATAGGTFTATD